MSITVDIDGDTYHLRRLPAYTEVERVGSAPFCQAYEDPAEALHFFAECVGMAYLREKFPGIQERFR